MPMANGLYADCFQVTCEKGGVSLIVTGRTCGQLATALAEAGSLNGE